MKRNCDSVERVFFQPRVCLAFTLGSIAVLLAVLSFALPDTRGNASRNGLLKKLVTKRSVPRTSATDSDGLVRIDGQLPNALVNAERLPGSADGDSPLALTIVLNRTDQQGFDSFLRGVQDPQSSSYRRYLGPREQADRFGPTAEVYKAVSDWLRAKGFTLVEGSANRLTLSVRGTQAEAERAFAVHLKNYRLGGRSFFANDSNPAVPAEIASYIQAVIGLSSLAKPGPSFVEEGTLRGECNIAAREGAFLLYQMCVENGGPGSGTPYNTCEEIYLDFFQTLYRQCLRDHGIAPGAGGNGPWGGSPLFSSSFSRNLATQAATSFGWLGIDGTGQTIGLLEFDTFNPNDIRDYLALVGYPATDINRLSQVHINGGAALGPEEPEVLMDIIAVMTNAKGANVVVYDAPFTAPGTSFQTIFNRMINDGMSVISNSWIYCEDQTTQADVQSLNSIFASAAAGGISILNASGDTGSTCFNGSANTVSVPADAPHATAVGGTSLTVGPALTYGNEVHWNGLNQTPPTGLGSFGVSAFFGRPAYQNGFTSSPMRSVPDIAVNSNPAKGIEICQADAGGCPTGALYGGTSLGAPLWAAFVALLNQAQGQNLGALNPLFYPLGNTDAFHSAASMGSDFQHVGLGSPNLNLIHRALSGNTPGAVSASVSENVAEPEFAVADGVSEAFIVVRLRDANGHTVSGKTVTLAANPGAHATITPASGVSNVANGAVIFSAKNTVPEAVIFTATDTTDGVVLEQQPTVGFVARPAAAGGISANPTTVTANGSDTTTITVELQDAKGNPSPNKLVNLSQGNGASIITTTTGRTDATGRVNFIARNNVEQSVIYTAVDVSDRNLPVPGSAVVNFINASGFCAGTNSFNFGTAAPGYAVTTFASSFPIDCFTGIGPIGLIFDAQGNLLAGDRSNSILYKFGPLGGIAGPATQVGVVQAGANLAGLAFTQDGRLYAALQAANKVVEVNPVTAAVIRTVVDLNGAIALAVDPISGDLFVSNFNGVQRISNFVPGPGTLTPYFSSFFTDGITFAPDGTLYVAANGSIFRVSGTNTPQPPATQLLTHIANPDGLTLEPNPNNPAKPFLYVNRNDGIITKIDTSALPENGNDPCGSACADIYTGGSRGDFLTVSPDGCDLYATQSERIIRLTRTDGTCNLAPPSVLPQIVLTPRNVSPSPAQGTSATFTARLRNIADPENIPIKLFVSGANMRTILVRTDANGNAAFTYTGISTGMDQVFASAEVGDSTLVSNEANVTWTPGRHSTFLSLNLCPGSGVPNRPVALTATLVDISAQPPVALSGLTLNFALVGQNCADTTNKTGTASCSITPNVAPGSYPVTATFDGTDLLVASSAVKSIQLIEARPATPISVVSRKIHGGAGTFDINLPLAGTPGIECRTTGGNYQVILTFANPVTVGGASVISGTGTVASFSVTGAVVTVNLTGVTNAQTLTLSLSDVSDGVNKDNVDVQMSILAGDTNGNGAVNASDVSQTKAQSGQPITGSNFRADVNADGAINAPDIATVKANSGSALP